jgi:DNA-binding MurR/RpiR family transcriptional regulator
MDTPTTAHNSFSYQERIHQQRPNFSRSYQLLADFLLDSYLQAALMTAHELAQTLDLDPATVVRFAQSLGYRGFPELQHELRQRVRAQFLPGEQDVELNSPFADTIQALNLTQRNLASSQVDALVELLVNTRVILLVSDPAGVWLAGWLHNQLAAAGFSVRGSAVDREALAAALSQSEPGDVLLGIDLMGESPRMVRALELAKQGGMSVALITGAASLPSAGLADISLAIYSADDPPTRLACAAAILNTLELALRQRYPERMSTARTRLAELTTQIEASD